MSFLSRLDKLWDAGFEVGRTSVNAVIDIVEAPFTDDEYEGLLGTVSGVAMKRGAEQLNNLIGPDGIGGTLIGALPEPVREGGGKALEGLEYAGREWIREPLTTVMTMASLAESRGSGGFFGDDIGVWFDKDDWKLAHRIAQTRSIGQAVSFAMATDDIMDEDQLARWEGTQFHNIMSGTVDAAFRVFGDVDILAGYTYMGVRGARLRSARVNYFEEGGGFSRLADDVEQLATDAGHAPPVREASWGEAPDLSATQRVNAVGNEEKLGIIEAVQTGDTQSLVGVGGDADGVFKGFGGSFAELPAATAAEKNLADEIVRRHFTDRREANYTIGQRALTGLEDTAPVSGVGGTFEEVALSYRGSPVNDPAGIALTGKEAIAPWADDFVIEAGDITPAVKALVERQIAIISQEYLLRTNPAFGNGTVVVYRRGNPLDRQPSVSLDAEYLGAEKVASGTVSRPGSHQIERFEIELREVSGAVDARLGPITPESELIISPRVLGSRVTPTESWQPHVRFNDEAAKLSPKGLEDEIIAQLDDVENIVDSIPEFKDLDYRGKDTRYFAGPHDAVRGPDWERLSLRLHSLSEEFAKRGVMSPEIEKALEGAVEKVGLDTVKALLMRPVSDLASPVVLEKTIADNGLLQFVSGVVDSGASATRIPRSPTTGAAVANVAKLEDDLVEANRVLRNARTRKRRSGTVTDEEIDALVQTRDDIKGRLKEAGDVDGQAETVLNTLTGRIREKYFPDHARGDLVSYELARAYLGEGGFTGGRESMEGPMRFFMGETSAVERIMADSPAAGTFYRGLFADTAFIGPHIPEGVAGANAAAFQTAQELADETASHAQAVAGWASIDEVITPSWRKNTRDKLEHSTWYRGDGIDRPGRLGRSVQLFRDMKPQRHVWAGDPNSGEQIARAMQEGGASADEIARFRGEWAAAGRAGRVFKAEAQQTAMIKRVVLRHHPDASKTQIDALIKDFEQSSRGARFTLGKTPKYDAERGVSTVEWVDDATGVLTTMEMPLTPAQLQQSFFTLDVKGLDRFLRHNKSRFSGVYKATDNAGDWITGAMRIWRPSMLLRPAWAIRVVGDEQLRMMSRLSVLGEGTSMGNGPLWELLTSSRADYVEAALESALKTKSPRRIQVGRAARSGALGTVIAGPFGAAAGAGGSLIRNNKALRKLIKKRTKIEEAKKTGDQVALRELGVGNLEINGYEVQAAFGDALSPNLAWRKLNSANRQTGYLLDNATKMQNDKLAVELGAWTRVLDPNDAVTVDGVRDFANYWERVVNDHWGGELGAIIWDDSLGNAADRAEALVRWMNETPSGRQFAQDIALRIKHQGADGWAEVAVSAADRMLSDPALRARLAQGQRVSLDDVRKVADDVGESWQGLVGTIHAQEQTMMKSDGILDRAQKVVDGLYERMGTLPTDTLSRNPYFRRIYEMGMRRRLKDFKKGEGFELSEDALRQLESSARREALQETRYLLYDLAETSQFGAIMKNVMPFFNAWQEVLSRWAGLTANNPVFTARMFKAIHPDVELGDTFETVEDDRGNRFFQFRVPEFAADIMGAGYAGGAADDQNVIRFRASSLNMITQGLPGFGPIIQIPASKLVQEEPQVEDALKFMLPYGPVGVLDSLQPAWMKRITSSLLEDRSYESQAATIMVTRLADMANGDLEQIDFGDGNARAEFIADVRNDAKSFMFVRAIASAFSPASVGFHSPYQSYIDAYRGFKSADPSTADDKFMELLVDEGNEGFFALAARFSKNNEGLPATLESEELRAEYIDLVNQFPEVGGLILGIEGGGAAKFSAAVYDRQLEEDTRPGSGVKRRERLALEEILVSSREREGWQEYGRINDIIYNEMRERGLPNLQVAAASELAAVKKQAIERIAEEFPLWAEAYKNPDLTKWSNRVDGMRAIVEDERLIGRDDIRLLSEYLDMRDIFTGELAERAANGGASTLRASSNQDMAAAWEEVTMRMAENPTFGDLLWRWLEFDPMSSDTWPESQQMLKNEAA
ncbi:MAG: hypothetical protein HN683_19640 [Gammaproteobacteria bacterium]|nr:hypothetical protein [Gammaproteobacteria bacterium]